MDLRSKLLPFLALTLGVWCFQTVAARAQEPVSTSDGPVMTSGPVTEPSPDAAPPDTVSFQTFYDSLASEGTWIQTQKYGYVWQPNVNDADWAPYTVGHWVYTDDGWTWVSDEPFGWAVYHYGRWVNFDGTGWCWVPGYTWGPAWVSWRYGDGYAGWAPLPPDSLIGTDYSNGDTDVGDGFHIGGDADSYYDIGPEWYIFLPVAYFGSYDYRPYYVSRSDNFRLVHGTTNVTNLNIDRHQANGSFGGVSLAGPSLLQVNAQSQTPVPRVNLAFTNRTGGGAVDGSSLSIFAPRVDVSTLQGAHPSERVRALGATTVNRGTDATRPLVASSSASNPPQYSAAEVRPSMTYRPAAPQTAYRPVEFNSTSRAYPISAVQTYSGNTRPASGYSSTYRTSPGGGYGSGYSHSSSGSSGAYGTYGTGAASTGAAGTSADGGRHR